MRVTHSNTVVGEPLAHCLVWCSEGIAVLNVDPAVQRTLMSTVDTAGSTHGRSLWGIVGSVLRGAVRNHGIVSRRLLHATVARDCWDRGWWMRRRHLKVRVRIYVAWLE